MARSEMTPTMLQVLHAIRNGYSYGRAIANATVLSQGSVYYALHRLKDIGVIYYKWEEMTDTAGNELDHYPPRKLWCVKPGWGDR